MNIDLTAFKTLIRKRTGLVFAGLNESKLRAALLQRMEARRSTDAHAYQRLLEREAEEFQTLVHLLTINETYFYREPEHIHFAVDVLIPHWLSEQGSQKTPLRLASAGCSSGEEPYSLAIALQERLGESALRQRIHILGGDIDQVVLQRAKTGHYSNFAFRNLPVELRKRYFDPVPGGFSIKPAIRARVDFHPLNMLDPGPRNLWSNLDLVFFRNVSIYFDPATRVQILRHISQMLRPKGVLIVSASETLANDLGVLQLTQQNGLFYFVNTPPATPQRAPLPIRAATPPAATPPAPLTLPQPQTSGKPPPTQPPSSTDAAPETLVTRLRQQVAQRDYAPAQAALDAALQHYPRDWRLPLLKGYLALERRHWPEAEAAASQVLEQQRWSVDAMLLQGLAAKWQGRLAEAIDWLRKATYSQHHCWPAHFHLAQIYRQQGETRLALRAYKITQQLLETQPPHPTGLTVIPLDQQAGEIRFICQHQIQQLGY